MPSSTGPLSCKAEPVAVLSKRSETCLYAQNYCRHHFIEFTYLRTANELLGTAEYLEKTVIFLVEATPLAEEDAVAAGMLQKASEAGHKEAVAEAALSAAAQATEAARKVTLQFFDTFAK